MKLRAKKFNDFDINDGVNYECHMANDQAVRQSPARVVYLPQGHFAPTFGAKVRAERYITLTIQMLGTPVEQIDALKQILSVIDDAGEHEFLVEDENDGNREYYVNATVADQPTVMDCWVTFLLAAGDGVWRAKTPTTDQKLVTASGDTKTISHLGNTPTPPIFTLTPTSNKAGGFAEIVHVSMYNPVAAPYPEFPWDITGGGWDTASLISDTSKSNQLNGGINAVVVTIDIDTAVGGGLPTRGMGYLDTEQISWTANSGTQLTGVTRGIGGTTAAVHADNTVIKLSHLLANGADVRVFRGGSEIDFWFGTGANAINQAATKIWINLPFQARLAMTLSVAISNIGTPSTVTFDNTKANRQAFTRIVLPFVFRIDNEIFTATEKSDATLTLSDIKRAQRGSSAATHDIGDIAYFIEHDIQIAYGNQTLSTAYVPDDTRKPIIALTSTNGVWTFAEFMDDARKRSGIWSQSIQIPGKNSVFYGGDHAAEANPWAEMGIAIRAWQQGSKYKGETAALAWGIYHPAGITDTSFDGEKYRNSTSWPAIAALQKSFNAINWVEVWNESSPSVISTFEAVTHNTVTLSGSYPYLRVLFNGGVGAGTLFVAYLEIGNATLTFTSANLPQILFSAAVTSYEVNCEIHNQTTDKSLFVRKVIALNESLEIDCQLKRITYLKDNSRNAFVDWDTSRYDWLDLAPGDNIIEFIDPNTTGLTLDFEWQDRML